MILLAGDFNSSLGDDPTGLDRIIHKYQLCDAIQHLHGSYSCATYSHGTRCIDYIFSCSELRLAIQRGGILPFNAITSSDHRAIFVDVDMTRAFQSQLPSLLKPPQRCLFSSNVTNCSKYVLSLYDGFKHHRIFQRVKQLSSVMITDMLQAIELAEAIDQDITRLMLSSEKKLH